MLKGPAVAVWGLLLVLALALTLAALHGAHRAASTPHLSPAHRAFDAGSGRVPSRTGDPRHPSSAGTGAGEGRSRRTFPLSARGASSALPRGIVAARLAGGAGAAAGGTLRAVVGSGEISSDDAAEQTEWSERGRLGAGARDLLDLANVRSWSEAPVSVDPHAPGHALIGPVELGPAAAYAVLGWSPEEARHWYALTLSGEEHSGNSGGESLRADPVSWTGIDLHLLNDHAGVTTWVVRLERVVAEEPGAAEEASRLLNLVEVMAPELAHALLDGEPLLVAAQPATTVPLRLAPLPPDPALRVVISAPSGREAPPVEFPLRPGSIRKADVDLSRLFSPESLKTVRLQGRVLVGASARPAAGARVEHLGGGPVPQQTETDAGGWFRFESLPAGPSLRFAVTTSSMEGGRPLAPERTEFDVELPAPVPDETRVTWRLPAYSWLVIDLPDAAFRRLHAGKYRNYPVFLLQHRRSPTSPWEDVSARHFLPEPGAVAVSVSGGGDYRVVAALNPALLYGSEPARVTGTGGEVRAALDLPEEVPDGRVLRVVRRGSGEPVPGASITFSGPNRSLPPLRGSTNARGVWQLPPANGAAVAHVFTPAGEWVQQVGATAGEEVVVEVD